MRSFWPTDLTTGGVHPQPSPIRAARGIAETPSPELDRLERDAALLVSVGAAHLASARSSVALSDDASTFAQFLGELNQFEGRVRSLLLDTRLSRCQQARLERVGRTFYELRPMAKLRRHVELAMRVEHPHHEFIRFELMRAIEAVATHGRATVLTMNATVPGQTQDTETAARAAYHQVFESAKRLAAVVEPEFFLVVRGGLLALTVASDAFCAISADYAKILDPNVLNRHGVPEVFDPELALLPL